jgi:NAD(P)H-dependent FMN reductase
MAAEVRILLISGSTRHGSGNTAALRTVQAVAPDGMACDEDWCRILSVMAEA